MWLSRCAFCLFMIEQIFSQDGWRLCLCTILDRNKILESSRQEYFISSKKKFQQSFLNSRCCLSTRKRSPAQQRIALGLAKESRRNADPNHAAFIANDQYQMTLCTLALVVSTLRKDATSTTCVSTSRDQNDA